MNTLILGAAGFIGSRVAAKLATLGEKVICFDLNLNTSTLHQLAGQIEVVRGDVTRIEDIINVMKVYNVQRVIQLAYILSSESDSNPHAAIRVNALGTSNVFEAARVFEIERVVYGSSIAVYGDQGLYGERPVTEVDPVSPIALYGATKLLNEHQAELYRNSHGLHIVGVRMGIVFGHGRLHGQGMWAEEYASAPAIGKSATLPYDPRMRASLIYVDDVAELLIRILFADDPKYALYNSGGETVTLEDLAQLVRAQIPEANITFGSGSPRLPYMVDGSRAEDEFEWTRPGLEERIADHIEEARRIHQATASLESREPSAIHPLGHGQEAELGLRGST